MLTHELPPDTTSKFHYLQYHPKFGQTEHARPITLRNLQAIWVVAAKNNNVTIILH